MSEKVRAEGRERDPVWFLQKHGRDLPPVLMKIGQAGSEILWLKVDTGVILKAQVHWWLLFHSHTTVYVTPWRWRIHDANDMTKRCKSWMSWTLCTLSVISLIRSSPDLKSGEETSGCWPELHMNLNFGLALLPPLERSVKGIFTLN